MVLTSLTVVVDRAGTTLDAELVVRDPWPGNGRRALTLAEARGVRCLQIAVFDDRGARVTRPALQCTATGSAVSCQ
jgi:hypothetical protein